MRSGRLAAGLAAASLILGPAAPATAQAPYHDAGIEQVDLGPHVAFGEEDANPPKTTDSPQYIHDRVAEMTNTELKMDAGVERIKIDPLKALHNRADDWTVYDEQFRQAKENNIDMYVTLSARGVDWTRGKASRAISAILLRYPGQIKYFSFGNEPNYHPDGPKYKNYKNYELRQMDGLTLPQTAHELAVFTQDTVRSLDPGIQLVLGELLGEPSAQAEDFLRQMVKPVPGMTSDEKLLFDIISVHTYGLLLNPGDPAPKDAWTINALDRIENTLDDMYASGDLQTPGQNPRKLPLWIGEHTWNVDDPNMDQVDSIRYWDDQDRKIFFRIALQYVCADPNVIGYNLYGPLPPPPYSKGTFIMQVIGVDGNPLGSYYVFTKTIQAHPECFITPDSQPKVQVSPPALTVPRATSSSVPAGRR